MKTQVWVVFGGQTEKAEKQQQSCAKVSSVGKQSRYEVKIALDNRRRRQSVLHKTCKAWKWEKAKKKRCFLVIYQAEVALTLERKLDFDLVWESVVVMDNSSPLSRIQEERKSSEDFLNVPKANELQKASLTEENERETLKRSVYKKLTKQQKSKTS